MHVVVYSREGEPLTVVDANPEELKSYPSVRINYSPGLCGDLDGPPIDGRKEIAYRSIQLEVRRVRHHPSGTEFYTLHLYDPAGEEVLELMPPVMLRCQRKAFIHEADGIGGKSGKILGGFHRFMELKKHLRADGQEWWYRCRMGEELPA